MANAATLLELDKGTAAVRQNMRDLVEQAAAYSGAADEDRASDRITAQETRLAALLTERDAVAKTTHALN